MVDLSASRELCTLMRIHSIFDPTRAARYTELEQTGFSVALALLLQDTPKTVLLNLVITNDESAISIRGLEVPEELVTAL